jgi:hypothetical protein
MKKRDLIIFSFIFFFFFLATVIFAQEEPPFDFNRAYQDYLYTYETYRQAHNEYITAKEQYLTYKTLTAKTLALEQTLNMLQKRDETLRTYLTALRMKMAETTGISNYKQNTHYLKLDAEVSWYGQHHDSLTSASTLEDLTKLSEEAEDEHSKTEVLAYQALGLIFEGKEENLKSQMEEQIELIKEKIKAIKEAGDKDTTTAERWLLEAENKLTRSEEKVTEANALLEGMKASRGDKDKDYAEAQKLYSESHLYLKEANGFLKELIREIKTAD